MRWSKIKNIILLLLVIVNLALVALVGTRTWRSRQNERLAREKMIRILENNNIEFLPAQVPDAMPLSSLRLTLESPGRDQALALVGELTSLETVGNRTLCVGELGTATLSPSGEIEVRYSPPYPQDTDVLTWVEGLGVELRPASRTDTHGVSVLTCTQLHDGVPIPGESLTLTLWEGGVRSLSFRLFSGTWETIPGVETATASTALLRFLDAMNRGGYVCTQVTDLYPGYLVGGSGVLTFTPAWYVGVDTRPWLLAVNAATGAVISVE